MAMEPHFFVVFSYKKICAPPRTNVRQRGPEPDLLFPFPPLLKVERHRVPLLIMLVSVVKTRD